MTELMLAPPAPTPPVEFPAAYRTGVSIKHKARSELDPLTVVGMEPPVPTPVPPGAPAVALPAPPVMVEVRTAPPVPVMVVVKTDPLTPPSPPIPPAEAMVAVVEMTETSVETALVTVVDPPPDPPTAPPPRVVVVGFPEASVPVDTTTVDVPVVAVAVTVATDVEPLASAATAPSAIVHIIPGKMLTLTNSIAERSDRGGISWRARLGDTIANPIAKVDIFAQARHVGLR